jgi:hypothetical protein
MRGLRMGRYVLFCKEYVEALSRTRTVDPLLTMEVLYQLS